MIKTILTAVLVLASVAPAFAEWGLYVNRDGKAWVIEQTFAFEYETDRNCKSAARALWATGVVKGVACQEYSAAAFSPTARAREQSAAAQAATAAKAAVSAGTLSPKGPSVYERNTTSTSDMRNRAVTGSAPAGSSEISNAAKANRRSGR